MTGMLDDWAGLAGRVALITGGAGGLGLPITIDLARAGVTVAVCDRDPEAVRELERQLGDHASYLDCFDVRDADRLAAFFGEVVAKYGRLDALVNVPGGSFQAPVLDMTPRGIDAVIRQNFTYVLQGSQLAAQQMRTQDGGGSIVQITSIEAHRAMPMMGVYGAMKAAVASLCKTLAVEWGPLGIRVNAVAPDIFPTPATAATGMTPDPGEAGLTDLNSEIVIPLGRTGVGPDLSGCVLFLLSDLAAYVTGTTVHVDGGTSAAGGWFHYPDGYANMVPAHLLAPIRDRAAADA